MTRDYRLEYSRWKKERRPDILLRIKMQRNFCPNAPAITSDKLSRWTRAIPAPLCPLSSATVPRARAINPPLASLKILYASRDRWASVACCDGLFETALYYPLKSGIKRWRVWKFIENNLPCNNAWKSNTLRLPRWLPVREQCQRNYRSRERACTSARIWPRNRG